MFWESVVGIVVMTLLVLVLGPVFWSSKLSLRDKRPGLEERPGSENKPEK